MRGEAIVRWVVCDRDGRYFGGERGIWKTWLPGSKHAKRYASRAAAKAVVTKLRSSPIDDGWVIVRVTKRLSPVIKDIVRRLDAIEARAMGDP